MVIHYQFRLDQIDILWMVKMFITSSVWTNLLDHQRLLSIEDTSVTFWTTFLRDVYYWYVVDVVIYVIIVRLYNYLCVIAELPQQM